MEASISPEAEAESPITLAFISLFGFVVLVPFFGISMLACKGGCSFAAQLGVILALIVESLVSLRAIRHAGNSTGLQSGLAVLLCLPGVLVATPLTMYLFAVLLWSAAKTVIGHAF